MTALTLYIGNKNHSSWSLRPWIGMRVAGIAFEEVVLPFDFEANNPAIKAISPTGCVPVLKHGDLVIPESLAILDHVARLFPDKGLWPASMRDHTSALSMSLEMVSGFRDLREVCPMNIRRPKRRIAMTAAADADAARIIAIWSEALGRSGGPFLFGTFSIADAMFAPVVNRFDVYDIPVPAVAAAYMARMKALPAWQEWEAAARAETWTVPGYEV